MAEPAVEVTIGIDVGGTFTDIVVLSRNSGTYSIDKVLSTPGKLWVGIMEGLQKVMGSETTAMLPQARIIHATTQATNAIIESQTAKVALITNRGFRDVLEIRRQYRTQLYDMDMQVPAPLVPRDLRLELAGRLDHLGREVEALDERELHSLIDFCRERGVEAYAVSFLHAYANSAHEDSTVEAIRARHPEAFATCSSEVCPEYREYERTSTTVINAAVMPVVDAYLRQLEQELRGQGYGRDLYIMQSNGGMMTASDIRKTPVNIIESGPAAGVVAAAALGRQTGRRNLLSFDMGGTTAKAALIHDGRIQMTTEYEVSAQGHGSERQEGYALRVPVMEIDEVGSGGGSIAWIDGGGALRVGPRSAGAEPGPVCYGRGGSEPTTTDANLVLGRLGAEYFLGGEMGLDVEGARKAVSEKIAKPLGLDTLAAAAGIVEVANSLMTRALRRVSVEKGRLPREYALVAFGGAGPLQAADIADDLGILEVLVPPFPGVASAVGLLESDIRYEYLQSAFGLVREMSAESITATLHKLAEAGRSDLARSGIPPEAIHLVPSAELRYLGQAYEIRVDWPGEKIGQDDLIAMEQRFHEEHKRLYAFATPERQVECVNLRLTAIGVIPKTEAAGPASGSGRPEAKGTRPVYLRGAGLLDCPVYHRAALLLGQTLEGPAIVEQKDSTTLVPPNWSAATDRIGNLVLTRQEAGNEGKNR